MSEDNTYTKKDLAYDLARLDDIWLDPDAAESAMTRIGKALKGDAPFGLPKDVVQSLKFACDDMQSAIDYLSDARNDIDEVLYGEWFEDVE